MLSMLPAGLFALWVQILLHEVGHAVAFALVGGKVCSIEVGGGRHVLTTRWFGVRVELRPLPRHGLVRGVVLGTRAYRTRWTLVLLAGPAASFVSALAFVALARAVLHARMVFAPGPGLLALAAAVASALAALRSWWPRVGRVGDELLPSDTLRIWRFWRLTRAQLAAERAVYAVAGTELAAFEQFLAGDPRAALATVGSAPEFTLHAAIYTWALEGAAAAIPKLEAAASSLSREGGAMDGAARSAQQLAIEVNRVFFAAEAGGDALREAAPMAARLWDYRHPRLAVVYRVVGLFRLLAGETAQGLQALETAWHRVEPAYLRAITAMGLALAHARRGDARRARRFLRKAARLHPESPMLTRYGALVENALAAAPAVA